MNSNQLSQRKYHKDIIGHSKILDIRILISEFTCLNSNSHASTYPMKNYKFFPLTQWPQAYHNASGSDFLSVYQKNEEKESLE